MNIGAFAVLTSLRRRKIVGDNLDDLNGLFQKAPTEALLMLVFLLSLAGIPPLAGFYGKYFIFLALIETGHYMLASAAVLFTVVGAYYYLKMANAMFMGTAVSEEPVSSTTAMNAALVFSAAATVIIGLLPNTFIHAVDWSLTSLGPAGVALLK
jgi:NADH-quinone oxidoreductase subunit N